MEYVIEANDSDDMRSWLATIRYCMRSTPTVQLPGGETQLTAMPNLTSIPASPPPATTVSAICIDAFYLNTKNLIFFQCTLNSNICGSTTILNETAPVSSQPVSSTTTTTITNPSNNLHLQLESTTRAGGERTSTSSNFELTEGDLESVLEIDTDLTAMMRKRTIHQRTFEEVINAFFDSR